MPLTKVHNRMIEAATVCVDDFGAVGDGVTDNTAAVQSAVDYCLQNTKSLRYGAGTYLHSGKVTVDLRVSGSPSLRRYIKIFGEGSQITRLVFAADGFEFIGAASAGVNNGDHRLFVERFSISQPTIDRTSGTAIRATDMTGLWMQDILVTGFLFALDLEDVLTSQFSKVKLEYAGTGVRSRIANYSRLNLSSFENCGFTACWTAFADVQGANLQFETCGFEGLGLDTVGDRGDYLARGVVFSGSPDGYTALNVENCYFENNKGEADVFVNATWTGSYAFNNANFNRASSTRYSVSNVILSSSSVGTEQIATFEDCGFLSVGTYVPDVSRPKIDVQNNGGFDNWFVQADRLNIGLFSGVDAFSVNDPSIKRFYQVPRANKGVYTPVIEGDTSTPGVGTYTVQSGIYERIGDMVFFTAKVGITAHTGTGTFKISLPPIAPDILNNPPEQPITMIYSGPSITATQQMCGYVRPALNTTVGLGCVQVLRMEPAGTVNGVVITNATYEIWISGSYRAVN